MGGIITSIKGPELVMATASLVSAVNFFVTLFFAPETLPPHKRMAKVQWKEANPFGAMEILTFDPQLPPPPLTPHCRRDLVTAGAAASYLLIWTALNGQQVSSSSSLKTLREFVVRRTCSPTSSTDTDGTAQEAPCCRSPRSPSMTCSSSSPLPLQAQVGVVLALSQSLAPKYLSPYLSTSNIIQLGLFLYLVSGSESHCPPVPPPLADRLQSSWDWLLTGSSSREERSSQPLAAWRSLSSCPSWRLERRQASPERCSRR